MTSVDGKILGEKWGDSAEVRSIVKCFEETHDAIGNKSWIVGRTTMEKDFTHFAKPVFRKADHPINREDFVAQPHAASYAVVIDGQGKLGWNSPEMLGEHVITVLTESVRDEYLAHLQHIGVSYIFAGNSVIDLHIALGKLRSLFGIETLMLEGGGKINGSFLNEGLIDAFYQLLVPLADGRTVTSSVFEIPGNDRKHHATLLKLEEIKRLEHDVVLLKYKVDRQV